MSALFFFLACFSSSPNVSQKHPVRVIFDTDMDTDCDDAGALALLHALVNRKEALLLATMVSSRYPWSVPCVAAINKYYGREDIPIACVKGKGASAKRGSRYAKRIALQFPTRYKTNSDAPDAVSPVSYTHLTLPTKA